MHTAWIYVQQQLSREFGTFCSASLRGRMHPRCEGCWRTALGDGSLAVGAGSPAGLSPIHVVHGEKNFLGNVNSLLVWITAGSVLELIFWLFYLRV